MRHAGFWVSNVLLYVLFVGATVSLLLGFLVAAGDAMIWRGLDFPIGWRQAARFMAWALLGYGTGWLLYSSLRGLFPSPGDRARG